MNHVLALSTTAALTTTSVYMLRIQCSCSKVPSKRIFSSTDVPASFKQSKAASIVNPKSHTPVSDTRHITLELPKQLSDEEILALFLKGFFGGWVFRPERSVLRTLKMEMMQFDRKPYLPSSRL
ncbi:hypothetical protein EJ02DRAFT_359508 [Clathrospora elynae]|uniref:Uncharacterized protein n=1 Tax=Clathrospora elynae TaxID=706981 RepID=A0A6A5S9R7_9PLEO|nr:hypothetical protein EJ02DRAFT_359508 [Clathrospora elynae]